MIATTAKKMGPFTVLPRRGIFPAPPPGQTPTLSMQAGREDNQIFYMPPLAKIVTDGLGNFRAIPLHSVVSVFNSLPNLTNLATAKDPDFVYLNNATVARATKGGINVAVDATNGHTAIITTVATDGSIVPLRAAAQPRFATRVNLTQIATLLFSATLDQTFTSVDPTASAGDGAGFVFDPNNTIAALAQASPNWLAYQKIAGADVFYDTGVAVVAGMEFDLEVAFDSNLIPYFFLNGDLVATGKAGTANATMGPLIGVTTLENVAKDFDLRYISVERFPG